MSEDYNPRDELLAAVDALTKPVTLVRWQDTTHDHEWVPVREWISNACGCRYRDRPVECPRRTDGQHREGDIIPGQWVCEWCGTTSSNPTRQKGEVELKQQTDRPLLEQLRDAIGSNIGGAAVGKPARERTPIDVGAFTTYEDLDGRIRGLMLELGGKAGKGITPELVLRSWFTLWTVTPREGHEFEQMTRVLTGWAQRIRDVLSQPPGFEITAPCPLCGREWVTVGSGVDAESVRVLSAVERETLDESYTVCRSCDVVWRGVSRMRQLRIAIDDAESLRREVAAATGLTVVSVILRSDPVVFFAREGGELRRGFWFGGSVVEWEQVGELSA